MRELSNKLVLTLLVVVILTTLISTLAFFYVDQNLGPKYVVQNPSLDGGKVSINIKGNSEPMVSELDGGKVSIELVSSEDN